MMNCEDVQMSLLDAIRTDVPTGRSPELNEHLRSCADCRALINETALIRDHLREVTASAPTGRMRNRFYASLGASNATEAITRRPQRKYFAMAAAVAIVFGFGYLSASVFQRSPQPEPSGGASFVSGTSVDRLAAVLAHAGASPAEAGVIDALLYALQSDPNANVRVAAVEALAPAVGDLRIATTLQRSILLDESPTVQAAALRALADGSPTLVRSTIPQYLLRPDVEPLLRERAEAIIRTEI